MKTTASGFDRHFIGSTRPVTACLLTHEPALNNVENKEALIRLVNTFPDGSRIIIQQVGANSQTQNISFKKEKDHRFFEDKILDLQSKSPSGSAMSVTRLYHALNECFPINEPNLLAQIAMIVATPDAYLVGSSVDIVARNIKTYVANTETDRPLSYSLTSLATDNTHVISIQQLDTFKDLLKFDSNLICRTDRYYSGFILGCQACSTVCQIMTKPVFNSWCNDAKNTDQCHYYIQEKQRPSVDDDKHNKKTKDTDMWLGIGIGIGAAALLFGILMIVIYNTLNKNVPVDNSPIEEVGEGDATNEPVISNHHPYETTDEQTPMLESSSDLDGDSLSEMENGSDDESNLENNVIDIASENNDNNSQVNGRQTQPRRTSVVTSDADDESLQQPNLHEGDTNIGRAIHEQNSTNENRAVGTEDNSKLMVPISDVLATGNLFQLPEPNKIHPDTTPHTSQPSSSRPTVLNAGF
ncbi:uncharacterized protein LOC128211554 isoform X2 [Mya arenaria]|uniref:uncharacterized protein LOC128211554 isoform X2 n=1 Tax=Mya arenaria TaxID=6604 RepID=UPI0022DF837B|nr:uncharacterized protein LOC128211554 isoform X2 [Mya arenaria]